MWVLGVVGSRGDQGRDYIGRIKHREGEGGSQGDGM